jgi:hypothetical protein
VTRLAEGNFEFLSSRRMRRKVVPVVQQVVVLLLLRSRVCVRFEVFCVGEKTITTDTRRQGFDRGNELIAIGHLFSSVRIVRRNEVPVSGSKWKVKQARTSSFVHERRKVRRELAERVLMYYDQWRCTRCRRQTRDCAAITGSTQYGLSKKHGVFRKWFVVKELRTCEQDRQRVEVLEQRGRR